MKIERENLLDISDHQEEWGWNKSLLSIGCPLDKGPAVIVSWQDVELIPLSHAEVETH